MSALLRNIALIAFCGILCCGEGLAQSEFSGERLKAAVLDYAVQELGPDTEIFLSQNIQDQKFSQSGVTAQINGDAESIRAMKSLSLEFVRGEQLVKRIEVPVRIRQYAMILRAARTLSPGEVISEDDFVSAKTDISQIAEEDIITADELRGKSLRRQISRGMIIPRSALIASKGIKRGAGISIIVQSGTVSVRSTGKALEDGDPGEMIRVSRDGATGNISGKVLDDGTVLITP